MQPHFLSKIFPQSLETNPFAYVLKDIKRFEIFIYNYSQLLDVLVVNGRNAISMW